jgi:hypothetical protein
MHAKLFLVGLLATLGVAAPLADTAQPAIEARQKKVTFLPKDYNRVEDGSDLE